jgi:preprotein translocase subunit SecG
VSIIIGILNVCLVITSIFLIGLVLIQRGRGGGLAGAFGGMGGSSAFGAKAGDVFTRVTMWTAIVWFGIAMLLVVLVNRVSISAFDDGESDTLQASPVTTSKEKGKTSGATKSGKAGSATDKAGSATDKAGSSTESKAAEGSKAASAVSAPKPAESSAAPANKDSAAKPAETKK